VVERLLTGDEVCAILKWKKATLYQKRWRGDLEYVKVNRSLRFRESYIRSLIEEGTVPARTV
jgi:hypothetical protein